MRYLGEFVHGCMERDHGMMQRKLLQQLHVLDSAVLAVKLALRDVECAWPMGVECAGKLNAHGPCGMGLGRTWDGELMAI